MSIGPDNPVLKDNPMGDSVSSSDIVDDQSDTRWHGLPGDIRAVLPAWITARILVLAGFVVATTVSHRIINSTAAPLSDGLLAWDGSWYRDLAGGGYHSVPNAGVRFFPLFPVLGRVLAAPFGGHVDVVLVVIANVASFVTLVLIRRLVWNEKLDRKLADRAVWCVAIFPSAFVMVFAYSESVMLALSVAAFLCMRQRRWWWVLPLGFLTALARPTGVLLAIPILFEALRSWRMADVKDRVSRAAAIAAPVAGLVVYLGWVKQSFGDARLPFTVQDELRGGMRFPLTRIVEGFHQLLGSERFGDGLHLPFLLVLIALVVVAFRVFPGSYGLYAAAILIGALSAENLNSIERYGLSAFPLLMALAVISRPPQVERAVMAVLGGGVVALSAMAWLGAYVP